MNRELIDKQIDSGHQYNGYTENHIILLAQLRVAESSGSETAGWCSLFHPDGIMFTEQELFRKGRHL